MTFTRREFTYGGLGAALTALLMAAWPFKRQRKRWVSLAPADLSNPKPSYLYDKIEVVGRAHGVQPGLAGDWAPAAAVFLIKPFPKNVVVEEITAFFAVREFTEEERPGTGGGAEGLVLAPTPPPCSVGVWSDAARSTVYEPIQPKLARMRDGKWAAMFDVRNLPDCKVPDLPLWVRAKGYQTV